MFSSLLSWLKRESQPNRAYSSRGQRPQRPSVRLRLEALEDRTLLSNFTAGNVSDLIADINAANRHGGSNTITLVAGKTFSLKKENNDTDGPTGLPVIAANDNLTINGNGDTIQRVEDRYGTNYFRLFDVAAGASLTLQNLTLQGGFSVGGETIPLPAAFAEGGAIYNQGALDLNGVTVQNNIVAGPAPIPGAYSGPAAGGGIYSSGVLTLEGGTTIQNNQVWGGGGFNGSGFGAGSGLPAAGGGIFSSGTLTIGADTLIQNNQVTGGSGSPRYYGSSGRGGGVYVASGTATLTGATVSANSVQGGATPAVAPTCRRFGPTGILVCFGGHRAGHGPGIGGGIYIDPAATVFLDTFTQTHVTNNTASTSDPDIFGSWTPI